MRNCFKMVKIDFFNNPEELMESIYQTKYEKENNITIVGTEIVPELSNDEIKVVLVNKSNGEQGLVLGFLISRRQGGWQKVMAYDTQLKKFPEIYEKYKEVDANNREIWRKRYQQNT